jgi:hypothetical protein
MSKEKVLIEAIRKYGPKAMDSIEQLGEKAFTKDGSSLSDEGVDLIEAMKRQADPKLAQEQAYKSAAGSKDILDEGTEKGFTMRDPTPPEGSALVPVQPPKTAGQTYWERAAAQALGYSPRQGNLSGTPLPKNAGFQPAQTIDTTLVDATRKSAVDVKDMPTSPMIGDWQPKADYSGLKRAAGVGATGVGLAAAVKGDTDKKPKAVAQVDQALEKGLANIINEGGAKSGTSGETPQGETKPEAKAAEAPRSFELEKYDFKEPQFDDSEIQSKLSEADTKERKALDQFKSDKQKTDFLRIAETLGKALLRYGAAQQGLRDNVDLSSVGTGPGVDWASLLQEDAQLRDQELNAIGSERSALAAKRKQLLDEAAMKAGLMNRESELNTSAKNAELTRRANQASAMELAKVRAEQDAKEAEVRASSIEQKEARRMQSAEEKAAAKAAAEEQAAVNAIVNAYSRGDQKALEKALQAGDKAIRPELKSIIDENTKGYSWFASDKSDSDRLKNEIQSFMNAGLSNEDRALQNLENDAAFNALLQKEIALRPDVDPKRIEAALRKKLNK